jgi:hypothetical protein
MVKNYVLILSNHGLSDLGDFFRKPVSHPNAVEVPENAKNAFP